ncbi:flagellar biosynthesis repressor FlbT [Devosia sp. XJ19-1]|uniref:Flagellar biosynthesis repressor FlbT n=1 Tax=Devosia ureilytica TaxID=2952754 RepID=A0A9Q4ANW0_9HYPH|nr:flagellar biosynthesis repressor FlbT [Devosia ureilytica]MCP8883527.1 flagellar biosynthesis repressor FlbT [Devosia ureilytica]MCP8887135.1 flagellar biosynthesis repressor FlbT [Devosia ureilytica]
MALKVELKPGEKLLVGNCIITNSDQRTRLFIDGNAPILREKDILTSETATTPAKRIYLAVQLMYIDEDSNKAQAAYNEMSRDFVAAVPSSLPIVDQINNEILTGSLYKALKASQKLIEYEQDLLNHASNRRPSVSTDGESR